MVGDGVGLLGSCDHGLLFMFDCDFLWCICLIRVLVGVWLCLDFLMFFVVKRGDVVLNDSLCEIWVI